MAYSKKLNLVFIHVPKCAGTSIIEAMREQDDSVQHGHFTWADHAQILQTATSFTIVRNPWDRAFSCYNYARMPSSYWHGADKKWGVHPDFEILSRYSFKQTVKILWENRNSLRLPETARPIFNINWSYQFPFVYNNGKLMIEKVFHLDEDMGTLSGWLKAEYGLDVPNLNVSSAGNFKDHYDEEMVEMVAEIYQKDIELFGFRY